MWNGKNTGSHRHWLIWILSNSWETKRSVHCSNYYVFKTFVELKTSYPLLCHFSLSNKPFCWIFWRNKAIHYGNWFKSGEFTSIFMKRKTWFMIYYTNLCVKNCSFLAFLLEANLPLLKEASRVAYSRHQSTW